MISRFVFERFQAHEKLVLNLSETITVLSGETESGKSSVARAVRWLALNKPSSDRFIRHRTGKAKVSGYFEDVCIIRERGGSVNRYEVAGTTLSAVGQSVPETVTKVTRLDDLNFQRQHDPHFWIALSSGEVSRELNALINLGLIDSTLANLNRSLRDARQRAEIAQERLEQARATRDALAWVEEAGSDLDALEKRYNEVNQKRLQARQLRELLAEGRQAQKTIESGSDAILDARKVLGRGQAALEKRRQADALREILREVVSCETQVREAEAALKKAQKEFKAAVGTFCPTCQRPWSE